MQRLLVLALIASIGNASVALAGESLVKSGTRHAQQMVMSESANSSNAATTAPAGAAVSIGKKAAPALQAAQGASNLESSGMRKRTKIIIALAIGVGFAASAYAIDHHVLDVTPSSLGTRQD